jgi:DNA-binding NarL/FixJ family response regulator
MAISVHVADGQTMFREGLAAILASRSGVEVVGQSSTGEEVVDLIKHSKPDVVVMQVDMRLQEAEEILSGIRSVSPDSRIVVLTTFDNPRYLWTLWKLGINACVHKDSPSEELLAAIDALSRKPDEDNAVVYMPRGFPRRWPSDGFASTLSRRETAVMVLAARGLGNRQIASHLDLAEDTVKSHLGNVYRKMGVRSRSEAVRTALAEQWIGLHEITSADGSNGKL